MASVFKNNGNLQPELTNPASPRAEQTVNLCDCYASNRRRWHTGLAAQLSA